MTVVPSTMTMTVASSTMILVPSTMTVVSYTMTVISSILNCIYDPKFMEPLSTKSHMTGLNIPCQLVYICLNNNLEKCSRNVIMK